MGIGARPATCASCGKRLNRKSWYYRNGQYFCKKRCWVTESEKAATEEKKAGATAAPAAADEAKAAAPKQEAAGANPAAS